MVWGCMDHHALTVLPNVNFSHPMSLESHRIYLLRIEDPRGCREFMLDGPIYSLGRSSDCDIRLLSHYVSRWHATLVQLFNDDGTFHYRIVDGNLRGKPSTNGLMINGRKYQSHDLQNEDEIIFCQDVRAIYYARSPNDQLAVPAQTPLASPIDPDLAKDMETSAEQPFEHIRQQPLLEFEALEFDDLERF